MKTETHASHPDAAGELVDRRGHHQVDGSAERISAQGRSAPSSVLWSRLPVSLILKGDTFSRVGPGEHSQGEAPP